MKTNPLLNRYLAANITSLFWVVAIILCMSLFKPVSDLLAQDIQFKNARILAPEVSHFTRIPEPGVDAHGDLSLSIPLMAVPGRDGLDFPIIAHYRSGIQVAQSASWIGLGWELDLGSITRHPLGGVEDPQGVLTYEQADFAHALPGYGGVIESQPDVYSVSMNGNSALLLSMTRETNPSLPYDPPQAETTGDCFGNTYSLYYFIASPWKPWKFCYKIGNQGNTHVTVDEDPNDAFAHYTQKHGSGPRPDFSRFIITTEEGTRYVYDLPTLSHAILPPSQASYTFVSTWRLKAILAPNYTGPSIPDGTSKGGWVKIVYKTWDHVNTTTPEPWNTIMMNDGTGRIIAQITYPYYAETPTHFAFFTTSKRYDRDLAANVDGSMTNGLDQNYYSRKLNKITLYKKTEAVGIPMTEPSPGSELNPQTEGAAVTEVSFKYIANGADAFIPNYDDSPSSPQKKMLSKLALEKISIKGLASTPNDSLPAYKFTYYDSLSLSWLNVTEGLSSPIHNYQDDFGYLDVPPSDPNYDSNSPTKGWTWSLMQITYPEGGRHLIRYTNDSLSALVNLNFNYNKYVLNTSYTQVAGSFERYQQGGARVRFVIKYDGYNDAAPDTVKFTHGPGHYSALSEVWGEVTKVEYLANSGKVKEDIDYWQFRGHTGDGSPLKLATVAPQLQYSGGSTPMIDLNFTHKQLDSVVTKSYFGASTVTSREAYGYNEGALLERKTETSGENKVRKTETTYMHDIPGLAIADSMKKKNLRAQIALCSHSKRQCRNAGGFWKSAQLRANF